MGIEYVKFRGRHNSWRAVLSLVIGSLAFIAFFVLAGVSAGKGQTTVSAGILGIVAAIVNLIGLIVSAMATQERDVFISVPIAGMVVNGISFLMYVIIYVLGLV